MTSRVAWLVLFACSARDAPPPPSSSSPVRTVGADAALAERPDPDPPKFRMWWSDIVETTPGCFYFSGPTGRDDTLAGEVAMERTDRGVRLQVGQAVFTGAIVGEYVRLERRSTYRYDGPWTTVETIEGRYKEGSLRARYDYDECEVGVTCNHRCRLTGTLTITR